MEKLHLTGRQTLIAITAAIACFLPPFIGEATNIALPNMLTGLGLSVSFAEEYWGMYGWVLTIYLLTSTIFLIPATRLADKFSKKLFFCIGVLLLGFGSLGIGFSTSCEMVILMRAIEGIGNALVFGTAIALVTSAVDVKLRGTAIGITMTGVFMGQLIGPLLAGALTDMVGWQAVYVILCPIALVSFVLALPFMPKDKPTDTKKYDWIGAIIFIIGMTLCLYGFSKQPRIDASVILIVGIILMILFVLYERKNTNPIVPINLILRNRGFTFNNGANLLYYVAIYSMGSLVSLYMTNVWEITDALPRAIIVTTQGLILVLFTIVAGKFFDHLLPKWIIFPGIAMTAIGIAGALLIGAATPTPMWLAVAVISASIATLGIGSILLGVIDRVVKNAPPKFATTAGLIIIAIGMVVLLTCGEVPAVWSMIIVQALFGIGIAIFVTPNSTAIMNSVNEDEYGMASGTLSTTRMLGMAISIGIVSVLKNIFLSGETAAYSSEFLKIFDGAVIASIVILFLAMILSWTSGKNKTQ